MKNTVLLFIITTMFWILPANSQNALQDSIKSIDDQRQDRSLLEEREARAQIQANTKTGTTIGQSIVDEAEATAKTLPAIWPRRRIRISSQYLAKQLLQEAHLQANYINQIYTKNSNATRLLEQQKQLGLEDSALGLKQQLMDNPSSPGIHLQPLGTNLYVRNYAVDVFGQ
jgi:hypothetical protein